LVSELRLTAGCVLMDLASPAVSGTSVYANGLNHMHPHLGSHAAFLFSFRVLLPTHKQNVI